MKTQKKNAVSSAARIKAENLEAELKERAQLSPEWQQLRKENEMLRALLGAGAAPALLIRLEDASSPENVDWQLRATVAPIGGNGASLEPFTMVDDCSISAMLGKIRRKVAQIERTGGEIIGM